MRRTLLIVLVSLMAQIGLAQSESAFGAGEWFRFRMSYSGFLKAGNATMTVSENIFEGKPVYHIIGKGWTTGAIKLFYKVEDRFESYIDQETGLPYFFIRDTYEGGYTKDTEIKFDQASRKAYVNDKKKNKKLVADTEPNVQDMMSAYYYLRNNYDTDEIQKGDEVSLNMFFDNENYVFKMKFLGRETLKTKFGKVKTLKFRPYVMAGRVFKEQESLTLWVSADKNKIPLRLVADLAVGSIRADLDAYKGLKHQFVIQF